MDKGDEGEILRREWQGEVKHPTEERVANFSGGYPKGDSWPSKNIHTDREVALRCGLKAPIASAAMLVGYLAELMIEYFGEAWFRKGKMDLKFIGPVEVGEKVLAKAKIINREEKEEGLLYTLSLWIEKEEGEKVAIGTANFNDTKIP